MADLVFKGANDRVLTNSLLVAEKFGKEHKHVLDAIRELAKGVAEISADPLFEETTYISPQNGQEYPMFIMNRDGFTLLSMGFTGKKALQFKLDYIGAFNKMEQVINSGIEHPQLSRKELALMVIQAEEEKERLMLANEQQQATIDEQEKQLKSQAPKVQYVDNVLQSVNTYTSTQIAKEVGMDAAKFHKALKERKVMFYQSGTWMLTAKYQGQGYTKMRTHQYTRNDGSIGTNSYTVFTERGRALMHSIFAK